MEDPGSTQENVLGKLEDLESALVKQKEDIRNYKPAVPMIGMYQPGELVQSETMTGMQSGHSQSSEGEEESDGSTSIVDDVGELNDSDD